MSQIGSILNVFPKARRTGTPGRKDRAFRKRERTLLSFSSPLLFLFLFWLETARRNRDRRAVSLCVPALCKKINGENRRFFERGNHLAEKSFLFTHGSKKETILVKSSGYLANFRILRYNIVIYSVIRRQNPAESEADGDSDTPPHPLR